MDKPPLCSALNDANDETPGISSKDATCQSSAASRVVAVGEPGNDVQKRDVSMLGVCLATVYKTVQANLVDRAGFDFQMLNGRGLLGTDFLVDPSESFLLEPSGPEDVK